MLRRLIFFGLVAGVALWQIASATPAISSITGTVAEGDTLKIYGSDFGTKDPAAPYRFDNFESGAQGDPLPNEGGGGWYTDGEVLYDTTEIRIVGTKSAMQDFSEGRHRAPIGLETWPDMPLYISGWFYCDAWGHLSRNIKRFKIDTTGLDIPWQARLAGWPRLMTGQMFADDCYDQDLLPVNQYKKSIGDVLKEDSWYHFAAWVDQGTVAGNDASFVAWLDFAIWGEIYGTFMTEEDCPFNYLLITHYHDPGNGFYPMPQMRQWWDYIYVDSTRARVEIGDSATWSACTLKEIQPATAWDTDSISVTINQGWFIANQQAYLYVVDDTAAVNANGFSITIGGDPVVDVTPPSAVNSLRIALNGENSITLSCKAVGDDWHSGTATTYDLRYSTSPINDGNWGAATQATGEPSPQAAGEVDSFTVNIVPATTYHFAIKVADEIPNWSDISYDQMHPTTVDDLGLVQRRDSGSIELSWTTTGDDDSLGTATTYDLRYSASEITEANWSEATTATGEPTPRIAGQADTCDVSGLDPGQSYFFGLKVADEVPVWSALSNVPGAAAGDTVWGSSLLEE